MIPSLVSSLYQILIRTKYYVINSANKIVFVLLNDTFIRFDNPLRYLQYVLVMLLLLQSLKQIEQQTVDLS